MRRENVCQRNKTCDHVHFPKYFTSRLARAGIDPSGHQGVLLLLPAPYVLCKNLSKWRQDQPAYSFPHALCPRFRQDYSILDAISGPSRCALSFTFLFHWHRLRQREGRHQAPRANCRPFTFRFTAEAPFVEAVNAPTSTSTPPILAPSSSYKHQQHPVSGYQHHQPLSDTCTPRRLESNQSCSSKN